MKLIKLESKEIEKLKEFDNYIGSVNKINTKGFEGAYNMAILMSRLEEVLDNRFMNPIMKLQGTKLGFRTDKDDRGGYPEQIVKKCVIEAVLHGLQVVKNQFNIMGGNMYPTKEGYTYLLNNISNLKYEILKYPPEYKVNQSVANVKCVINYSLDGIEFKKEITFPVRVNKNSIVDAVIGKADRKAKAYLYTLITDNDLGEGDVTDSERIRTHSMSIPAEESDKSDNVNEKESTEKESTEIYIPELSGDKRSDKEIRELTKSLDSIGVTSTKVDSLFIKNNSNTYKDRDDLVKRAPREHINYVINSLWNQI